MLQLRPITTNQLICVCDRCSRDMNSETHDGEWEERISLSFRGGYHSIFGDGNLIECDLCQHCIKAMLEKYLRITHDDPVDPKYQPQSNHYRAYQHFQLREAVQLDAIKEEIAQRLRDWNQKNSSQTARKVDSGA